MTKSIKVSRGTPQNALILSLLVGLVVLSLGCGASAQPAATESAATNPIAATQQPAIAPDTRPDSLTNASPVGTQVGNRIPSFAIKLVDGTQVTSAELLREGQPTFLISFTTW